MARWKWFTRPDKPIDVIGPATAYPDRAGAYGPTWNGPTRTVPTIRPPAPLMTPGQRSRASDPGSADR